MKVAIIGGGAAGFFSAITLKEKFPDAQVCIFEKTNAPLAKVKVSGGGRCNVTNACTNISELIKAYPRGGKHLKKLFSTFSTQHAYQWFEQRGVPLVTQDDECVFPESQESQSIITCFFKAAKRLCIDIETNKTIRALKVMEEQIALVFDGDEQGKTFDKVIVTTGGAAKPEGLHWLAKLGHKIEAPVPSLFTFNIPKDPITKLMGIVVENALVSIQSSKFSAAGPLLITHWGMSGPAVLKLSSYGARLLNEQQYNFNIQVNWVNEKNNEIVANALREAIKEHPNKMLANVKVFPLQERLWIHLIEKCELSAQKIWSELGNKGINKLTNILTNDIYTIKGKTTFREEFVTCGGVSLESVNMKTMESKIVPNLYFAGEVLDIDAITGGFNLQAAWTTGYIAGHLGK